MLLLVSGLAVGRATYLLWLPCRGSMLDGTILKAYGGSDITDACYTQMDSGRPLPAVAASYSELMGFAMLAAAAAWLVLVLALRWRWTQRVLMLPLVGALAYAGAGGLAPELVVQLPEAGTRGIIDLALLAAVLGAAAGADHTKVLAGPVGVPAWRACLPLAAIAGFGMVGALVDYSIMVVWSDLNWDTPPGMGYLSAAALVMVAVATVVLALRRRVAPLPNAAFVSL